MNVCLSAFLANQDRIAAPFRKRALWVHTAPLRERLWDTLDGQVLLDACMWRVVAQQELNKRGLQLSGGHERQDDSV